jgi:hypothetical protein
LSDDILSENNFLAIEFELSTNAPAEMVGKGAWFGRSLTLPIDG